MLPGACIRASMAMTHKTPPNAVSMCQTPPPHIVVWGNTKRGQGERMVHPYPSRWFPRSLSWLSCSVDVPLYPYPSDICVPRNHCVSRTRVECSQSHSMPQHAVTFFQNPSSAPSPERWRFRFHASQVSSDKVSQDA